MSITLSTYPNINKPLATNDRAVTWGILPSAPVPSNVNYQITFQASKYKEPWNAASALEVFTEEKSTDAIIVGSTVLQTPINLNRYLEHLVWNDFNNTILFGGALHYDRGAWSKIRIDFKEKKLVSGVMTETDTEQSAVYKIINAKLNSSELNLNNYAFALTGNFNPQKGNFLNQRPNRFIYEDEYVNLYFVLNASVSVDFYKVIVSGVKEDNTTFSSEYDFPYSAHGEYIAVIPVGVKNGNLLSIPSDAKSYTIHIETIDTVNSVDTLVQVSESKSFEVIDCDCCKEEMYFQSEKGAFDTIRFERIESKDISVSQSEVLKDVITLAGADTLDSKLFGAVRQINTQSSERITLLSEEVMMNEKEIDYFRQFKQSQRRYIRQTINGQTKAVSFIVEPSETRVYQYGDTIRLQVVGYLGNSQLL